MRPPPSIAAGKRPVEELALKVNWLPEEGPANILNVKQLLVVALLLIAILLLFAAELAFFNNTSALLYCGHQLHTDPASPGA